MKAAIHNPYLDTLGGGERYTLSFASALIKRGYEVHLEWSDPELIKKLESRFGMDLKEIKIISNIGRGDSYDLCFWISDGSIPLMRARKNILHFQVPFHEVNGRSLMNRMKLFRIAKVVCNSNFTKNVIDREFGVKSVVIYPPVDTMQIKSKRKENIVLYVGRFSKILQQKNQDILITSFKDICQKGINDWKLIIAGGAEVGSSDIISGLKDLAKGFPIEILESPDFDTIKDLYGRSRLFWSASGYNQNENKNPEKMEHFGITVVEAMSAGTVPIIFNGGGHKEIIKSGINGFLWDKPSELIAKTVMLIKNSKELHTISDEAKKSSENYSLSRFENDIDSSILQ